MVKGCAILAILACATANASQDAKDRIEKLLLEHSRKILASQAEAYAVEVAAALTSSPARTEEAIRQFEKVARKLDGRTSSAALADAQLRFLARSDRETLSRNLESPPLDSLQRQALSAQVQQLTAALESVLRSRVRGSQAGPLIEQLRNGFASEAANASEDLFDPRFKAPLPPETLRDTVLRLQELSGEAGTVEVNDEASSRDPETWMTLRTSLLGPFNAFIRSAYKAPDSPELSALKKAWQADASRAGADGRSAEDMFAEKGRAARAEFEDIERRIKAGRGRPEAAGPLQEKDSETKPRPAARERAPLEPASVPPSRNRLYLWVLLASLALGAICVTLLWRRTPGTGGRFPTKSLMIAVSLSGLGLLGAGTPPQSAEELRQRAGEKFFKATTEQKELLDALSLTLWELHRPEGSLPFGW